MTNKRIIEQPPYFWYDKFEDLTYSSGVWGEKIPSNSTALKILDIPLRKYDQCELEIIPTRTPYKAKIKSFSTQWKCPKCRYNLNSGHCYCNQNNVSVNYYYDFKSILLSHF